jgi:hypothetical protein
VGGPWRPSAAAYAVRSDHLPWRTRSTKTTFTTEGPASEAPDLTSGLTGGAATAKIFWGRAGRQAPHGSRPAVLPVAS